ncbi:hypothetical protein M405DRAFT_800474 [Rhizopogon salebrosus TDB-379]|nr:hypothetical protein M405DRAFT_800474 [Rhizopogon salebrosus TDB-379]
MRHCYTDPSDWGFPDDVTNTFNIHHVKRWTGECWHIWNTSTTIVMSTASTGLQTAQYFTVGAMAVAIYDYCLTIAPEVQLIWGRRWNVIRITFTLTRYLTFIGAAMTTYGLLIFRTFAFWQQSKKVLIWLLVLAAVGANLMIRR